MASPLHVPIPFVGANKNTCKWSMVPMSNLRASSSKHGMVEPKPQRWLRGGGHGVGIGKKGGDLWRVRCQDWSCGIPPPQYPLSTIETIKIFYSSINDKPPEQLEVQLGSVLTQNCEFNDLVFYLPFQGKEGVIKFLKQLKDAMGKNVKLITESITEGEGYSATVTWHLAWDGHQLPFTSGCYFFQCEKDGEKLLIKSIRGLEELPLKPGEFAMKLLKTAVTLFDQFPIPAERILEFLNKDGSGKQEEGLISMIFHLLSKDHQG
ncbi:putative Nuclear transport factor 2 family protein [Cinnamomum micranthum f. kanehirae]|uniref:Putative Nuclear transport factor 2 family protein n=1 Tax=Cinnamomum micranthum f. kanehirae TaxID=337451 RepID=A0A3S3NYW2_9MAGN|nr:putative Nuclear transport factor 2 family protein [Cinnamomum micranthum f. kanehirae]